MIRCNDALNATSCCRLHGRSGGFDKGWRLIRLSAIGLPLGMPASARSEPPQGFPPNVKRSTDPRHGRQAMAQWRNGVANRQPV